MSFLLNKVVVQNCLLSTVWKHNPLDVRSHVAYLLRLSMNWSADKLPSFSSLLPTCCTRILCHRGIGFLLISWINLSPHTWHRLIYYIQLAMLTYEHGGHRDMPDASPIQPSTSIFGSGNVCFFNGSRWSMSVCSMRCIVLGVIGKPCLLTAHASKTDSGFHFLVVLSPCKLKYFLSSSTFHRENSSELIFCSSITTIDNFVYTLWTLTLPIVQSIHEMLNQIILKNALCCSYCIILD